MLKGAEIFEIGPRISLEELRNGRCAVCERYLNKNNEIIQICNNCMPDNQSRVFCKNCGTATIITNSAREAHPHIDPLTVVGQEPVAFIVFACRNCDPGPDHKVKKVTALKLVVPFK